VAETILSESTASAATREYTLERDQWAGNQRRLELLLLTVSWSSVADSQFLEVKDALRARPDCQFVARAQDLRKNQIQFGMIP
jgi:hypothetical protein